MSPADLWVPVTDKSLANVSDGQAIDLDIATWEELAYLRRAALSARSLVAEAASMLDAEVARRLDLDNKRSRLVGDVELRVNAPSETEWDMERLRKTLAELVLEGRLGNGVPPRAVRTDVTYKPMARELNKLLTHDDPRVRERIGECRHTVPVKRRVTVITAEDRTHANRH